MAPPSSIFPTASPLDGPIQVDTHLAPGEILIYPAFSIALFFVLLWYLLPREAVWERDEESITNRALEANEIEMQPRN